MNEKGENNMKEKNVKIINGGSFVKEDFEKWCKDNGRDVEHKMSIVEYTAEVLKNEGAKEVLEKIKSGEVSLDEVRIAKIDGENPENATSTDMNIEGLKLIIIGLIKFGHDGSNDKTIGEAIKKVERIFDEHYATDNVVGLQTIFELVMLEYGKTLYQLLEKTTSILEKSLDICKLIKSLKGE